MFIRYPSMIFLVICGVCPWVIAGTKPVLESAGSDPIPLETTVDQATAKTDVADIVLDETWTKHANGLAYQLLEAGSGERAVKLNDYVVMTYVAFLAGSQKPFAGTESNKGFNFQVGHASILAGIQQGIVGMKLGEKRKLHIPPALGFGNRKAIGVPPSSTLRVNLHVIRIESPVTWQVLERGSCGPVVAERTVKNGDVISVNYVGKLEDGTIFDSNESSATPFRFGVGSQLVVTGFSHGVQGMAVGEKRRVTIPAHLAYGDRVISKIPAKSTLIFDMHCLAIEQGVKFQTIHQGQGPAITKGKQGHFAIRIETITGKTIVDTQFAKPLKMLLSEKVEPVGLYYMALGMKVGEVRQAIIPKELGMPYGKKGAGYDLKATLDLVEIQ
ncbi:MAG: FKBP-type peptidyl-prolyl cis-trans isomerase [Phycisphaeraceae bacterium]|nr:FKBP-type peptidyl-prolyl cis-trans isomerase [Phycisphaeraceae bacterium]